MFAVVGDPVGSGLVASLARPGGNLTGLSTQHADAVGKRLEILRETVPALRRLAIMADGMGGYSYCSRGRYPLGIALHGAGNRLLATLPGRR